MIYGGQACVLSEILKTITVPQKRFDLNKTGCASDRDPSYLQSMEQYYFLCIACNKFKKLSEEWQILTATSLFLTKPYGMTHLLNRLDEKIRENDTPYRISQGRIEDIVKVV